MTNRDLRKIIDQWGISSMEAARVLGIQKSKMSEYLKGEQSGGRKIPRYIEFSVIAHNALPKRLRATLIKKRLKVDK